MQFKYPELLWALFLLLIPIFIHLFQLRRFQKTPFTNVQMLQKVISKTRKTRNLKKWLLLFTRLLLFTFVILAFAQPFLAKTDVLKKRETVIYLDNSFSLQAKENGSDLLKLSVQGLIKNIDDDDTFSLFTNDEVFRSTELKSIKNNLLSLDYSNNQLKFPEITLKANTLFSNGDQTEKNLILISDFQQSMGNFNADSINKVNTHLVALRPGSEQNIYIDSTYISKSDAQNIELSAILKSNTESENVPVSLFNADKLIAKTSAVFGEDNKASVLFSLPKNEAIDGKIEITDNGLTYDNTLYFTIGPKAKIKTLIISGTASTAYLERIFTEDEFTVEKNVSGKINYSRIADQNIIVLNELDVIPSALNNSLKSFTKDGGSLIIIPSNNIDKNTYNLLIGNYFATSIADKNRLERKITGISFSHPLYKDVFEKKVANFQYPIAKEHYKIKTSAPSLLNFEDGTPFLIGNNGIYMFAASISNENSNFKGSPLIVPTLYNMGSYSLKLPRLYNTIGTSAKVDVSITASDKSGILKIKNSDSEFVPLQQSFNNKTRLTFLENPNKSGTYNIVDDQKEVGKISFNYSNQESVLSYISLNTINVSTKNNSIASLFQELKKEQHINELWKWFVILALVFVVIEILIQKFIK